MAVRGGGGAVSASIPGRRGRGVQRRRIEAETVPPLPCTDVSGHAPSRVSGRRLALRCAAAHIDCTPPVVNRTRYPVPAAHPPETEDRGDSPEGRHVAEPRSASVRREDSGCSAGGGAGPHPASSAYPIPSWI